MAHGGVKSKTKNVEDSEEKPTAPYWFEDGKYWT